MIQPYYQDDYATIYHGDCREIMPMLNIQVDMVLCDLPYGTTDCKWDCVIPFDLLWREYKRLTKENAAIVLTAVQPFTTRLIASNLQDFKYEWIWEKNIAGNYLNHEKQPLRYHENVPVFYRKQPTYNKQLTERKQSAKERVKSGIFSSPTTARIYDHGAVVIPRVRGSSV